MKKSYVYMVAASVRSFVETISLIIGGAASLYFFLNYELMLAIFFSIAPVAVLSLIILLVSEWEERAAQNVADERNAKKYNVVI